MITEYSKTDNAPHKLPMVSMNQEIKQLKEYLLSVQAVPLNENNLNGNDRYSDLISLYTDQVTWINKIIVVMIHFNRPLKTKELVEILLALDRRLHYSAAPDKCISGHILKAVVYGRIIKIKITGIQTAYYLLPIWLDNNNGLLPEYKEKLSYCYLGVKL
jgi:hypothetical protein